MTRILGVDRPLPSSDELEQAMLASYLLDPEWLGREPLVEADFYFERHRLIYAALRRLYDAGGAEEIDLRSLQAELEASKHAGLVGGLAYLSSLDVMLPDLSRAPRYARRLRELTLEREIVATCQRVLWGLHEGFEAAEGRERRSPALEATERLETLVHRVGGRLEQRPPLALGPAVDQVLCEAEARAGNAETLVGLATGLQDWDLRSLGLTPGELVVIAARPGDGKTTLALNIAAHVAMGEGRPAGVLSVEMGEHDLARRILANVAGVALGKIRSGSLRKGEWDHLIAAERRLAKTPLSLRYEPAGRLARLTAQARAWRAEEGLDLLVIDYLQLLTTGGRWPNRNLEIGAITRALKQLAGELQLPVILLSQLSRESRRARRKPDLQDLRDSGSIEQDADRVAFIHQEETDTGPLVELLIRKDRHGPSPYDIPLTFDGARARFRGASP